MSNKLCIKTGSTMKKDTKNDLNISTIYHCYFSFPFQIPKTE